ncbi:Adhesin major subunit pilin [Pseudomonas savastanoi pv. glycinea]|uniref:Adhesin major subunit pilin n=2 Tax=Pseudomonas savastanoi TaxID=29438 RepID=A0A3M3GNZ0_PSESG|nr:Adhesin major subunit pilin [Pseudomonas savastanoi pv. phaseolicola]RMM75618.1 Adhesin major subunit pilin [Pseudomonas savastanoi pv. glycinea]RMQ57980.1 Adhesin major subunit pilin [Pseudomonas savastanoi pv. glycinea]RMR94104.1 Adhesin major subunit pilin [Pseudomonas savastanoi pv. glycinea]RMT10740.1 Adhesin major subunit pilin [Pseudomonas savastanoi pv. phaseolicola]
MIKGKYLMKKSFLLLPFTLVACGLMASTASAYETDIVVTANVDTTLGFTQADGSAIPKTLDMQYVPATGLKDKIIQTRLYTNDTAKNLLMRLGSAPQLTNTTNSSAPVVPLTVSFMGSALGADKDLTILASNLNFSEDGTSAPEEFKISQTQKGPLTAAGIYSGNVNLIITQAAAAQP